MVTTPYQFAKRGNLFIVPVGPTIADAPPPVQSIARPPDNSLWVHGQIQEPGLHLDSARMSPRLYREVRDDLTRYSPVEVTRSVIQRSHHAYVGVIDSRGTPYYFALDSRGVSIREASSEDAAWKAFDRLADLEHKEAVRQRRSEAEDEMRRVDRELSNPALVVVKSEGVVDAAKHAGLLYAAMMRRIRVDDIESGVIIDDLDPICPDEERLLDTLVVVKALPKKANSENTKKAPSSKASKKQAGAGGKTRYTYPREKAGTKPGRGGGPVPLVVVHDDTKHADPNELANQLNVSVRTLQHAASHLGRDGFCSFMRARLKRFSAKHRLDHDYWNTLYANLVATSNPDVAKSDGAGLKEFGDKVKATASAVPKDHPNRFGDRKVFIHHVHSEMKRNGTYSGSLDEFKHHVVQAHKDGHLVASRADLVGAMNPNSVRQSETNDRHAQFHFINASHDHDAAKKLESSKRIVEKESKPKKFRSANHEAAHIETQAAHEASAHAARANTHDAHLEAMAAHHRAGVAHQKATGRISNKTALNHFDQAMAHLKASKGSG